jgi:hypothetical protein
MLDVFNCLNQCSFSKYPSWNALHLSCCFIQNLVFTILDDGQSPETQWLLVSDFVFTAMTHVSVNRKYFLLRFFLHFWKKKFQGTNTDCTSDVLWGTNLEITWGYPNLMKENMFAVLRWKIAYHKQNVCTVCSTDREALLNCTLVQDA